MDDTLQSILREIPGIYGVYVRKTLTPNKVFVVILNHDIKRDEEIVSKLCEVPDIAMDLVPFESIDMIPRDVSIVKLSV